MYYQSFSLPRSFSLSFLLVVLTLTCFTTPGLSQTDKEGYQQLFDGKTLKGWEGDTTYWRMENGILVGEITPATLLKTNSFLIWRAGVTENFELKTFFRITAEGNSGINYRSEEFPGVPFALKGYQADIDGKNTYTGLNYEERGRTFLARRGEKARIETGKKPEVVAKLGSDESLLAKIKTNDWNEYHLIAKGNHLQHYINGVLMSEVTDDDKENRKSSGLLGVQVHVGPPMKVEYRNMRLKKL